MSARLASSQVPAPERFSRRWFLDGLRTFAWVALITFLIWVYADLHFTVEEEVRVRLAIHASSSGEPMVVLSKKELPVVLRVKGNRHVIRRLEGNRLRYDAGRELGPGEHRGLATVDLLERVPALRRAPVQILGADPAEMTIVVEAQELLREVPVELDPTGGEAEEPRIEPARVDLLVPASQRHLVGADRPLKVRIDLSQMAPGQVVRQKCEVQAPPGVTGAVIRPAAVAVSLTVASRPSRTFRVPIQVQAPNEWFSDDTWQRYELKKQSPLEWTRQITVTGNRIRLEKLRAEDIRAYIVLDEGSLKPTDAWYDGRVIVELPEGLVADPVGTVGYRLDKRSEATPAP